MKLISLFLAITWIGLWFTPDQQGQRDFDNQKYAKAAVEFTDVERQGVAWFRAGEFEKAAQAFAKSQSPTAKFNEGNSWMLLGKYENAIERYEKALKLRPEWKEAEENLRLAKARSKLMKNEGGDLGDQKLGADKIVFDKKKNKGGQDTQITGEKATTDTTIQSMWLRRVQTKPSEFLRSKFAYQLSMESEGGDE
ncbi:Tetratricopeptide repeat protein [Polystyrenella longa]|uniref:Tetratricopeptide repeat protein n=1 Tax=Polystyrenella longa TaxID=2528007 RepID=A0A518CLF9_9PLAN|nr:tetratricopeptide repeat protein [Polystyrenella longa]QDU80059.1 Tetratricopeptide repeat protein [Polystyrenella longa]